AGLLVARYEIPSEPDHVPAALTAVPSSAADSLRIDTPKPGDTVSFPVHLVGSARGSWFFEATFPVRILDASGNEIARAPAHAEGDWMTSDFVPFTADITLDTSSYTGGPVTIVLAKDNPSGLAQNDASVSFPLQIAVQ